MWRHYKIEKPRFLLTLILFSGVAHGILARD
jgi:hypothetical protein